MGKRTNTAVWLEKYKRWQINVQKDGKRRSFTSSKPGRTGQREANAKADAWLDDGIENNNQKVKEVVPLFLEDLKARTSRSHYRPVEGRFQNWILPMIGGVKVSALNDQHLQTVINNAYTKGGLSKKTLKNIRNDLNSFVKFCRKSKRCDFRPEDIVIPASAAKSNVLILQPEHLSVLMKDSSIPYYGKIIDEPYINGYRLQVLTGLRPGELLGLRKSDRDGNVVHVQRSLNAYKELTTGKNDNAQRSIILTEQARQIWDKQAAEFPDRDELFPLANQQAYHAHLKKYCEYHHLPPVSPYGLRHTFVSIVKTLPEGMVKDLVGHSEQMDTFGVYGHALENDQNEIRVAIDKRFLQLLEKKS